MHCENIFPPRACSQCTRALFELHRPIKAQLLVLIYRLANYLINYLSEGERQWRALLSSSLFPCSKISWWPSFLQLKAWQPRGLHSPIAQVHGHLTFRRLQILYRWHEIPFHHLRASELPSSLLILRSASSEASAADSSDSQLKPNRNGRKVSTKVKVCYTKVKVCYAKERVCYTKV